MNDSESNKRPIIARFDRAIVRAVWGFFAFIPFCWVWGVEFFTLFAFVGTLYFVPVHYIFDKVIYNARE